MINRTLIQVLNERLQQPDSFEVQIVVNGIPSKGPLIEVGLNYLKMLQTGDAWYVPIEHIQALRILEEGDD